MAKPIQALRAAYEGNVESMADALTGRGAKQAANRTDELGRGTLTCAVAGRSGDEKCAQNVKMLLRAGADVNMADKLNQTALHFASLFGRPLCAIALIEAGADVDITVRCGMRPIHLALRSANAQVVSELIWAGADIASPAADGLRLTPLQYAKHLLGKSDSDGKPEPHSVGVERREALGILELHLSTGQGTAPKRRASL